MPTALLLTLGLHTAAAAFWLLSSLVLGFSGNPSASKALFRPQMVGATLAVFTGGGLWQMLHASGFGRPEAVLALGSLLAVAAAGVQGAMVGGAIRRLPDPAAAGRIKPGQRIAAALLAGALICMMVERYV